MPEEATPDPFDRAGGEAIFEFSRAGARDLDRLARERFGMPELLLIEHAADAALSLCRTLLEPLEGAGVLLFCGPGNNGADGYALARMLRVAGARPAIVASAPIASHSADAAVHARMAELMNIPILRADLLGIDAAVDKALDHLTAQDQLTSHDHLTSADHVGPPALLVDALLGTGLDRPVRGNIAELIERIAALRAQSPVLALDIPTGLDADTGRVLGSAVRADVTITFAGLKPAFRVLEAQPFLGEVVVGDLGLPIELLASIGTPVSIDVPIDRPDLGRSRRMAPRSTPSHTRSTNRGRPKPPSSPSAAPRPKRASPNKPEPP